MSDQASKATLFIVTAPSGAGKTSLVKALVDSTESLRVSVSHTTRAPRAGEVDGVNYHFIDKEAFSAMRQAEEFSKAPRSTAIFTAHRKLGSTSSWLWASMSFSRSIGKARRRCAISIPRHVQYSFFHLRSTRSRRGLTGRGQDDAETIARRMRQAVAEISHVKEADYIL